MGISRQHDYIPAHLPTEAAKESAWVLVLLEKKILMKKVGDKFYIPEANDIDNLIINDKTMEYIGKYDGHDCYCKRLNEIAELPDYLELIDLMKITNLSDDSGLFMLAGTANHILHWYSVNQYCGCCGHKTLDKKDERARICPNCGNIVYPRISPATITAVFRDDQILLAHNRNFKKDLYSLIAGFVEPGETLEQCVTREIGEEVGIKVKNIRYFSSQPWPFPDSLMMAFTAEYESGELIVDNCEIMEAAWYKADSLPEIPSSDSIAGKIIRWYRDQTVTSSNYKE
ncbi:MAG: pyrophosphatase [Herbinix sp.]|jgi:NAD+ diphosphatase|nr:pyrophosphatase [Herbinix sp.]